MNPAYQIKVFLSIEVFGDGGFLGGNANDFFNLKWLLINIVTHDGGSADGWFKQAAQHIDGGSFTSAIRTKESEQFSLLDIQLNPIYCHQTIKYLGQVEGLDSKVITCLG